MTVKSDLIAAAMLLTRLPMPEGATLPAARAAWAWPLVGAGIGLVAGLTGWLVWAMGATPAVASAVALTCGLLLTGAMHEDGLADVADGFWGGRERARRLEIMRDSRVGTYGVTALVLSLLLRWSLIATAMIQGQMVAVVVTAAIVSRAAMPVMMRWLAQARGDGLSHGAGRPPAWAAQAAVGIAGVALLLNGGHGIVAALLVTGVLLGLGALARAKIGGQTGDVLGAAQQLSEIAVLVALTSL